MRRRREREKKRGRKARNTRTHQATMRAGHPGEAFQTKNSPEIEQHNSPGKVVGFERQSH